MTARPGMKFHDVVIGDSDTSWHSQGLCYRNARAHDILFHPSTIGKGATHSKSTLTAKRICESCQVQERCLDYALDTGQAFGVWGGTTPQERRRIATHERLDAVARAAG